MVEPMWIDNRLRPATAPRKAARALYNHTVVLIHRKLVELAMPGWGAQQHGNDPMSSSAAALPVVRTRLARFADALAIAVEVALPWSSSAVSIPILLLLLAISQASCPFLALSKQDTFTSPVSIYEINPVSL